MDYKGHVYLTRYSGNVALLPEEVYGSNAASLDYWSTKIFVDNGYCIHISEQMMSVKLKNFLAAESIPKEHSWMRHIKVHKGCPWTTIPDYINYVIIHQGHENYRFLGPEGIPCQVYTYRFLRDCKCPVFYFQYDAALPLWLPAETRSYSSEVAGSSLDELCHSNIIVVSAGKQPRETINSGYWVSESLVRVVTWEKDFHAIASPMINKMSLPVNNNPLRRIQFVGKNRNKGSRGNDLLNLSKVLESVNSDYYVQLNGDWKKLLENDDFSAYPKIKYEGKIPGGIENVIKSYNDSTFGILMGNDLYEKFNQYTIRVFEVISSGTVPLFEKSWYSTWKNIFDENTQKFIEDNLMFDTLDDIPSILNNYDTNLASKRGEIVKLIRDGINSQLNSSYVNYEFNKLLEFAASPPPKSPGVRFNSVINKLYYYESNSKFKRISSKADENKERRLKIFNDMSEYNRLSNDIGFLRGDFCFASSSLTDEEIIEKFGRK